MAKTRKRGTRLTISNPAAKEAFQQWLQTPEGQQHMSAAGVQPAPGTARGRQTTGAGKTTGGLQPWAIKRKQLAKEQTTHIESVVAFLQMVPNFDIRTEAGAGVAASAMANFLY